MSNTVHAMSAPVPSLSLIVPMCNESVRIANLLREMAEYMQQRPFRSEIVLIDDRSSDDGAAVVAEVTQTLDLPVRLIRYARNRGKGYALEVGFDVARGDLLVFSDCDLSTPIEELPRFLAALGQAESQSAPAGRKEPNWCAGSRGGARASESSSR